MSKAAKLRELFHGNGVIRAAGAHDGLSAKLVEQNGFDCVWSSGFEISASYAVPDANILTMTQYLEATTVMNDSVSIPIVADCDTGYGNSNNVMHMIRKYEEAGIAAVTIEDKKFPKVNSYIAGRQELAPIAEFVGKILAAKNTQQTKDFMVIARVEALIAGWGQEEALKRAHAYVEAGADAILIHSKASTADEIAAFSESWDFSAPLVIVPTAYPSLTVEEAAKLGIKMIIYANHGLRAAIKATNEVLAEIKRAGRLDTIEDRIVPMSTVFELQGMVQMKENEKIYLRSEDAHVRAIIPAAGTPKNQDSLAPLFRDTHPAMLDINGKSVLQRNVETLNRSKIYDISVVRGYNKDCFDVEGVNYFDNRKYQAEYILSSIMCARSAIRDKTLIIYSDILFERQLIDRVKSLETDFLVVVDNSFKKTADRNKKLDLVITKEELPNGNRVLTYERLYTVERIGANIAEEEASAEFIGMAMLSEKGSKIFQQEYQRALEEYHDKPFHEAENIRQASLEDFLQHIIGLGYNVHALQVNSGWTEIHTFDDYRNACKIVG